MFTPSADSADDRSNSSVEGYDDYSYDAYDYDISEPCEMSSYGVLQVAGHYILSVICILGLIGNCLVILAYAFCKRYKSMIDVYLLNVAVADLLFAAALPVVVYNEAWGWTAGPLACKLLRGAYSVNLYSGMLLLVCVSADHYVAFVLARRSVRLCSPFCKWVNCCVVWLLALALSFPTFYFYDAYQPSHLMTLDYEEYEDYDATVAINRTDTSAAILDTGYVCGFRFETNATALVPGTQMAAGIFLPLLIVAFCCSAVTVTLLRTESFQKHKEVRVLLAVAAVFVACHLPYNISMLVDALTVFSAQACGFTDAVQTAKTVTKTLAYLHCCLNPVLYALFGVRSRSKFNSLEMKPLPGSS